MIGGLYMIYVPRKDPDDVKSMTHRARVLRERLEDSRTFWREEDMTVGVDVWEGVEDIANVDRALFIGQSFNGEQMLWDVNGQGEYKILVENDSTIRFGGNSLDEFIRRTLTPDIKTIFGPGYEPLPSQFEGRD